MNCKHALFLTALFLAYLFMVFKSIHMPFPGDSYALPLSTESFLSGNQFVVWHPLLYVTLQGLIVKLLGNSIEVFRILGLFSFMISLFMVYLVTAHIADDIYAPLLAASLYAINPMAVQGSLITDIDTTILTPLVLLFIYLFIKYWNTAGSRKILSFAILFTFLLWTKIVTPVMLLSSLLIYKLLTERSLKSLPNILLVFILGTATFIFSWFLFTRITSISFYQPFEHLRNSFFQSSMAYQGTLTFIRGTMNFNLWVSPFLLILFCIAAANSIRNSYYSLGTNSSHLIISIFGLLLMCGYSFMGNSVFGYPKYHYPFVSLCCILSAWFAAPMLRAIRNRYSLIPAILVITFYYIFFSGDIIYSTGFKIKEALIYGIESAGYHIKAVLLQFSLYVLPLALSFLSGIFIFRSKDFYRTLVLSLFLCAVSSNIALDASQYKARYRTFYCYGGELPNPLASFLRSTAGKNFKILAPGDILYLARKNNDIPLTLWNSPDKLLKYLIINKCDYVIYGISANTLTQYQTVFTNSIFADYLNAHYSARVLGDYTIWQIRNEDKS